MKNFNKLALIVALGSTFAVAQSSMPQSSTPQSTTPSSTSQPATPDQQPSAVPDQGKSATTPDTLPNTDQKKDDSSKLPQSDAAPSAAPAAAPAATGDVQGNIQSAIQKDPSLANSSVTVDVKDGKSVDLTGTVASKDAKDAAERIAKENSNGLKVKNHLKIAGNSSDNMNNPKTDSTMPAPKL